MNYKNIIIAIDLINNKCVRLTKGNFLKKKIYSYDPLEISLILEDNGISRLHLVDLDGARIGKVIHWNILEKIAKNTNLIIDFGGGIHKNEDIKKVFDYGASIATVGSIAVKNPFLLKKWIKIYKEKILLGIDVFNNKIAIKGWTKISNILIFDFIKKIYSYNVRNIFCTDINRDGTLSGPPFNLYKKIIKMYPKLNIIASGGISNIKDIKNLVKIGCNGIIIGKAFYEKKIVFKDIKKLFNNYVN
ncbi:1-(5-phosphoribosyl)-5-[(5-phosphoribosylamino)methylideneamino]imidazole-4-carboxamide isomerase [Blattabacterium cuenoti]|uniref:1-(5-phosphoribosyl)-5-[(5- phosphoribosylamino)methylideneamino]imidazole-4- carboxamide isomerase n=1 Tax=Blattabacterium cuenoti TaxID=1653831 RepID=UPI00163C3315|nr:1-(5-phosphoribosyl)-5-[(5-phosphoribosylamino)methylideneamino] imidazole-4-carboxamide isomerase [Blattabacterium cuenoti]